MGATRPSAGDRGAAGPGATRRTGHVLGAISWTSGGAGRHADEPRGGSVPPLLPSAVHLLALTAIRDGVLPGSEAGEDPRSTRATSPRPVADVLIDRAIAPRGLRRRLSARRFVPQLSRCPLADLGV